MATLSGAALDSLPDSDFAYIQPGGKKDDQGKTVPRSLRHFCIKDAAHVRDALARIAQGAQFGQQALPAVKAAAKKFGVDVAKTLGVGHEVKSFTFKMDGEPDAEGRFTGFAAVFGNVDRGNDVIDPGAVTKTLQENPEVPLFWQHDYSVVPIGVGTLSPAPNGVRIEGKLFIETSEAAREVYGALKAKAVKGLSIGYNTIKRAFEGKVRRLQEIAIGEVSLCNSPMNPLAVIDGVKDGKWLGQFSSTESVDCVLNLIENATDYLASEIQEGDTDDVGRLNQIIPLLMECLASEIAGVSSDLADDAPWDEGEPDNSDEVELMSGRMDVAMTKLQALLEAGEPGIPTRQIKEAAEETSEPDLSTLQARLAALRAA